jgi:hypothetical protein
MKLVIDRVLERRNSCETNAADAYQNMMKQLEQEAGHRKEDLHYQLRNATTNSGSNDSSIDRWKDDRVLFPKCCSRLGENYQVGSLPHSSQSDKNDMESDG